MLIRKKLTADEFSSPYLRYNSDCDCVQFTPDGGDTWVDQPSNDPRTSGAYRLPALTGGDTQCRAAEGMTSLVRKLVDERIDTDTAIEFAGGILGIVAFIPGFNVLWALIIALASFAVTIAREVLEAAFEESDYDQIRCIFYCNIGEDGQMSQGQFDAAYADLIDLNAIARTWCQAVFNTFGCVGLSDAGVALEAAADCDECACDHCLQIDFEVTNGSEYGFVIQGGTWTLGSGVFGDYGGADNQSDVYGYWAFDHLVNVKEVVMGYYKGAGGGGNNVNNMNTLYPTATGYSTVTLATNSSNVTGAAIFYKTMTPNTPLAGVGMDINTGSNANTSILKSLLIRYTGEELAEDNCI